MSVHLSPYFTAALRRVKDRANAPMESRETDLHHPERCTSKRGLSRTRLDERRTQTGGTLALASALTLALTLTLALSLSLSLTL